MFIKSVGTIVLAPILALSLCGLPHITDVMKPTGVSPTPVNHDVLIVTENGHMYAETIYA